MDIVSSFPCSQKPVLSYVNPVHFITTLASLPGSSNRPFPFNFSVQNILIPFMRVTCLSNPNLIRSSDGVQQSADHVISRLGISRKALISHMPGCCDVCIDRSVSCSRDFYVKSGSGNRPNPDRSDSWFYLSCSKQSPG
jgi:hypothetical protein